MVTQLMKDQKSKFEKIFLQTSIAKLRSSGARITKPRIMVLELLASCDGPLSVREIEAKVNAGGFNRKIDTVTLYRILDRFQELDIVHRLSGEGLYLACRHMTCSDKEHIMMFCSLCRESKEVHIPAERTEPVREFLQGQYGFSFGSHVFHLEGTCSACQQKTTH